MSSQKASNSQPRKQVKIDVAEINNHITMAVEEHKKAEAKKQETQEAIKRKVKEAGVKARKQVAEINSFIANATNETIDFKGEHLKFFFEEEEATKEMKEIVNKIFPGCNSQFQCFF